MARHYHRIGMIVPSSNTTMEIEIPDLLRRQQEGGHDRFSLHSARLRLTEVTPKALQAMNQRAEGAVEALCDAEVHAIAYACLVAVMSGGGRYISDTQIRLSEHAQAYSHSPPLLVTSAGALIDGLKSLGASKVAMITPYHKSLTSKVEAALGEHGIEVLESRSLEVVANVQVGKLAQPRLIEIGSEFDLAHADALVISACVQMPSLEVVEEAEQRLGLPVISAATATVFQLLSKLGIQPNIANAGCLLRLREKVLRESVLT